MNLIELINSKNKGQLYAEGGPFKAEDLQGTGDINYYVHIFIVK